MPCPTTARLLSFVAGELESLEAQPIADHMASSCGSCALELAAIAELKQLSGSAVLEEPPPWIVRRASTIPAQPYISRLLQLAGSVAALVFDTLHDPSPVGTRSASLESRQMLFRALGYDIDVRVTAASGGTVRIAGQVLPGAERPMTDVVGIEVALVSEAGPSQTEVTNELGEFEFSQISQGNYALVVEASDDRLLIEKLSAHVS